MNWGMPKTAKNRGELQKMTSSSETEFFLGWFRWESCSPGHSGYLLHRQKSRSQYKKLTFGPKYPNFWVKKVPSGQLEHHRSMFLTRKRCLIGLPTWGYQNFYSLPPKKWIFDPKTAKFGPKLAFSAKYGHFWPIWSTSFSKKNLFCILKKKLKPQIWAFIKKTPFLEIIETP